MNALIVGLLIVVVCVFPVMITARKLKAGKSDLIDCVIAVIVGSIASSLLVPLIPGVMSSTFLAALCSLAITGLVYKFMLQATYLAGFIIALVPAIIYFLLDILFA